ncbi:MAG: Rossman fold protein, TIGR00730 family [Candidatus Omnitrophica bacterium 4484_70.2]|nr:MAG: Rossman fold protein, TIGR00730 family [Candidatus Omnitrophica bacterium 4484_70.2]
MRKSVSIFKNNFLKQEPWRVFRIMSEFVEGIEGLSGIKKAVSFFGSKRAERDSEYYKLAYRTAKLLANNGYDIITGAGPGIMEAANKGAFETKRKSVGLNILIPEQQTPNPYVNYLLEFRYFFVRKVIFVKYSCAFVVLPGGFGTLDELFEAVALIQTHRVEPFPVVLMNRNFWGGLLDWFKQVLLQKGTILKKDFSLLKVVDEPQEVVKIINNFSQRKRRRGKSK